MAIALFLCPIVGTGTREDPKRGKYMRGVGVIRAGSLRFSRVDHALVMIEAPQSYLDTVAVDPECRLLATPQTIDTPLTQGQVNGIKSFLELNGIPAQWLQAGETRRQALRGIAGMFLFAQRLEGRFGTGFRAKMAERGITLETQWQDFPQVLKDEFIVVRDLFGWDAQRLGLTNTSTMREILKVCGDQFQSARIEICGVVL